MMLLNNNALAAPLEPLAAHLQETSLPFADAQLVNQLIPLTDFVMSLAHQFNIMMLCTRLARPAHNGHLHAHKLLMEFHLKLAVAIQDSHPIHLEDIAQRPVQLLNTSI